MLSRVLALAIITLAVPACAFGPDDRTDPGATDSEQFPLPDCDSDDPCKVAYLSDAGVCEFEDVPGCVDCVGADGKGGTMRDGACCTGCWAGSWCSEEPNQYACGASGGLCSPCNGAQMCIAGACSWGP
jgi:hypothetical protein